MSLELRDALDELADGYGPFVPAMGSVRRRARRGRAQRAAAYTAVGLVALAPLGAVALARAGGEGGSPVASEGTTLGAKEVASAAALAEIDKMLLLAASAESPGAVSADLEAIAAHLDTQDWVVNYALLPQDSTCQNYGRVAVDYADSGRGDASPFPPGILSPTAEVDPLYESQVHFAFQFTADSTHDERVALFAAVLEHTLDDSADPAADAEAAVTRLEDGPEIPLVEPGETPGFGVVAAHEEADAIAAILDASPVIVPGYQALSMCDSGN